MFFITKSQIKARLNPFSSGTPVTYCCGHLQKKETLGFGFTPR